MSIKCKRCGRKISNKESIERGYGAKCYRIIQLGKRQENPNESVIEELLNRIRKLELDNNFIKHQLKHKTIVSKHPDEDLDWDIKPEIKQKRDEYKIEFNVIIKELRVIFTEDFNYHDILEPINARETIEKPPMIEVLV